MALITDATKALEAELSIFVRARDEANDRMKRIIYLSKGKLNAQARRSFAATLNATMDESSSYRVLEKLCMARCQVYSETNKIKMKKIHVPKKTQRTLIDNCFMPLMFTAPSS